MKRERIAYIDNIKGFLIILVVLGHVVQDTIGLNNVVGRYIYSFHMPLFMTISGYCCSESHFEWNLIKKRAVRLLVPFIVWAVVKSMLLNDITYVWTIIKYPDRGLWFLQSLFWINVIVVLADKCSKNLSKVLFYSVVFLCWSLVAVLTIGLGYKTFGLPFIGWYLPFFMVGFALKRYRIMEKMNVSVVFALLATWCVAGYWCYEEIFHIPHILHRFIEMIVALIAIFGWLCVFYNFINKDLKVLSFLGRKTLSIYAITVSTELFLFALVRPYTSVMPYIFEVIVLIVFLMCFALALDWTLDKNKYTRILFLGKSHI